MILLRIDPEIMKELVPWREAVAVQGNRVVGQLRVPLEKMNCSSVECNLGNFIADSYIHHFATAAPTPENTWTSANVALVGAGGLRTTLSRGCTLHHFFIF